MLAVLGITIAAGIASFVFIDSTLSQRASLIQDLAADSEILDAKIMAAREAEQNIAENRDVATIIDKVLPPQKIQSNIVGELLKIASNNGINLNNIGFPSSDPTAADFNITQTTPLEGIAGVRFIQADIDYIGSFDDTLNLLVDMSENRRKMQVSSISLIPQIEENGRATGLFSVSFTVEIFVRGG